MKTSDATSPKLDGVSLDARSLALHQLAVQRVREMPQLFEILQTNLTRWRTQLDVRTLPYVNTWQSYVDRGLEATLQKAVEQSQEAAAMRQASPFAGVLSNQERWAFFKAWNSK